MGRKRKEIEIKLRVGRRAALLRKLKQLGARPMSGRVHEMNVLFDTPGRALLRRGEVMRVRIEQPADRSARWGAGVAAARGNSVTLTYKARPGQFAGRSASKSAHQIGDREGQRERQHEHGIAKRYKVREEHELHLSSAEPLEEILGAMGLEPAFRYEKYRQAFRLPGVDGVRLDFDETPIGDFLELEGKPVGIDRAAGLLGYAESDYIVKGYGQLYWESLGLAGVPSRRRPAKSQPARSEVSRTKKEPVAKSGIPGMLFPGRWP